MKVFNYNVSQNMKLVFCTFIIALSLFPPTKLFLYTFSQVCILREVLLKRWIILTLPMDPLKPREKFSGDLRIIKQIILLILDIERLSKRTARSLLLNLVFHVVLDTKNTFI